MFTQKDHYKVEDLMEIMEKLRGEDGCPWDREQTHKSIRKDLIEETYEVAEAIDCEDSTMLCEELGDLLLQVVFHSHISQDFNMDDVADGICKKLILRHPHVFGDVVVSDSEEVLRNWDEIKKKEKGQLTATDSILAVPRSFPALMRAQKVQKRAKKTGFEYPTLEMAIEDLESEIAELKMAIANKDEENQVEELGDILFAATNVARFIHTDAEEALTMSTDKFVNRFAIVEELAIGRGIDMKKESIESLNALWAEAKKGVKKCD